MTLGKQGLLDHWPTDWPLPVHHLSHGDVASSSYKTTGNFYQNYDLHNFVRLAMLRKKMK